MFETEPRCRRVYRFIFVFVQLSKVFGEFYQVRLPDYPTKQTTVVRLNSMSERSIDDAGILLIIGLKNIVR